MKLSMHAHEKNIDKQNIHTHTHTHAN